MVQRRPLALAPDAAPPAEGVLPPLTGAAATLLADYPGPIFALGADGAAIAGNARASALVERLGTERVGVLAALAELGRESARLGEAGSRLLSAGNGQIVVEMLVLPQGAGSALALGRDAGPETIMRRALVESRQRYKDLVEIVSDFAWETDAAGDFVFVSPRGALGFSAAELVGRPARALVSEPEALGGRSPFATREPVSEVELWVTDKAGSAACLRTTARPLTDAGGAWRGARGLSRNVTRERLDAFARSRRDGRERVVAYIVEQIRDGADPLEMLDRAVEALCGALAAEGATVAIEGEAGGCELVLQRGAEAAVKAAGAALLRARPAAGEETVVEAGHALIVFRTRFRGGWNGVVAVARPPQASDWSADDRALTHAVEAQLGVILAQLAHQRRLEVLSRTDPLTGLLNRRAFVADLDRQLARAGRDRRPGALLYVDLDNFKPINDRLGHAQGDEALIRVARVLAGNARRTDIVARLGGDEFALWLAQADEAAAVARAQRVGDGVAALPPVGAGDCPRLAASIGIACWTPGAALTAEQLLRRADRAMYAAKRAGKSRAAASGDAPVEHGSAA